MKKKFKKKPSTSWWLANRWQVKKKTQKHMDRLKAVSATVAGPPRPLPTATDASTVDASPAAAPGHQAASDTASLTDRYIPVYTGMYLRTGKDF